MTDDEELDMIIAEREAMRVHRDRIREAAEEKIPPILEMLGRLLEPDGGPAWGCLVGCTPEGAWSASVTLSEENWIRILAALEGVEPDAIRAYLALGGS